MKKLLVIIMFIFLLTGCSTSEANPQYQAKDDSFLIVVDFATDLPVYALEYELQFSISMISGGVELANGSAFSSTDKAVLDFSNKELGEGPLSATADFNFYIRTEQDGDEVSYVRFEADFKPEYGNVYYFEVVGDKDTGYEMILKK